MVWIVIPKLHFRLAAQITTFKTRLLHSYIGTAVMFITYTVLQLVVTIVFQDRL